jgi:hypothetical protein
MAVVLFDHLDRCAHLFCEEINIDAFGQAEGRIGMTKAISAASAARRAVHELGVSEQPFNEGVIEGTRNLTLLGRKYVIVRLGGLAEFSHALKVSRDAARRDEVTMLSFSTDAETDEFLSVWTFTSRREDFWLLTGACPYSS